MYLGGGTPFGPGSGWTPLFQTRNYDNYPALVLCAEWFGNNTSGRGIMMFDARKGNNGSSPLDQVLI